MSKVFIIAEAGVNHNGDISIAKKLIDAACDAGADAVKFQTFKAENIVSKKAEKAAYQKSITDAAESQFEMIKKLELDESAHIVLMRHCKLRKIQFLSTPFDTGSIELLNRLGLDTFKIPSGDITNLPYLREIGKLRKKIILSTGMSNLSEIADALKILTGAGTLLENITVLHANTEYPTPFEDVNLLAMNTIAKTFGVNIGYSDHTLGIEVPIAAVTLGACIIEKHFTLDRKMKGPDHKASLEPVELKAMICAIRNIEKALGNNEKVPSQSEKKNIQIARKSIHINKNLFIGDTLKEQDLSMKRPGSGIIPMKMFDVIGKKLICDMKTDDILKWENLQ